MADRPILFSGPMVRALLAGTKTQTRRILKPQPELQGNGLYHVSNAGGGVLNVAKDDIGAQAVDYLRISVGDRLWVRESLKIESTDQGVRYPTYAADGAKLWPLSEWTRDRNAVPSIHMPRYASRLTLTVTDVRVERLQDCSRADAIAEGVVEDDGSEPDIYFLPGAHLISGVNAKPGAWPIGQHDDPRKVYRDLINNLHGGDLWSENPWVAAYTFTVAKGNIDQLGDVA